MSLLDQRDNKKSCVGNESLGRTASNGNWERDHFTENIKSIFTACQDLIIRKNSDYTKLNESDPFFNFRQECVDLFLSNVKISDKIDGITLGLLTRLNDKRRRRENLLLTAGLLVIDETIEDTIRDEINYLAILLCHLNMHGRHLIAKGVPTPPEITWQDREIEEKNREMVRLYRELDHLRNALQASHEHITILTSKKKNGNRNRKSAK